MIRACVQQARGKEKDERKKERRETVLKNGGNGGKPEDTKGDIQREGMGSKGRRRKGVRRERGVYTPLFHLAILFRQV